MAMQATGGDGRGVAAVAAALGVLAVVGFSAFFFVSGDGWPAGGEMRYTLLAVAAGLFVTAIAFTLRRQP